MLIQSTAFSCFQTVMAVNQGTKGYLRYRRLLAYHMTHSVTTRLLHMPGRKRARDASIQVTSKNRRIRRTPTTVGKLLTAISKSLLFLDAVPKIPAMAASDVMALYFFTGTLLSAGWAWPAAATLFLPAHHIRDPRLLRSLSDHCKNHKADRASTAVQILGTCLARPPLSSQTSGSPYFPGHTRFHTGAAQVKKWLRPQFELLCLTAVSYLVEWSHAGCATTLVQEALCKLPGMSSYAYHVIRSWSAVCKALKHSWKIPCTLQLRVRDRDDAEIQAAANMSPHVKLIYDYIDAAAGWSQITYTRTRCLPSDYSECHPLQAGDQALLCCELQGFLAHIGVWPRQSQAVRTKLVDFTRNINLESMQTLRKKLQSLSYLEKPILKSKSRREREAVNAAWPAASQYDHSSTAAKNFRKSLSKAILHRLSKPTGQ